MAECSHFVFKNKWFAIAKTTKRNILGLVKSILLLFLWQEVSVATNTRLVTMHAKYDNMKPEHNRLFPNT